MKITHKRRNKARNEAMGNIKKHWNLFWYSVLDFIIGRPEYGWTHSGVICKLCGDDDAKYYHLGVPFCSDCDDVVRKQSVKNGWNQEYWTDPPATWKDKKECA